MPPPQPRLPIEQRLKSRGAKLILDTPGGGRIVIEGVTGLGGMIVRVWEAVPFLPPDEREPDAVVSITGPQAKDLGYAALAGSVGGLVPTSVLSAAANAAAAQRAAGAFTAPGKRRRRLDNRPEPCRDQAAIWAAVRALWRPGEPPLNSATLVERASAAITDGGIRRTLGIDGRFAKKSARDTFMSFIKIAINEGVVITAGHGRNMHYALTEETAGWPRAGQ